MEYGGHHSPKNWAFGRHPILNRHRLTPSKRLNPSSLGRVDFSIPLIMALFTPSYSSSIRLKHLGGLESDELVAARPCLQDSTQIFHTCQIRTDVSPPLTTAGDLGDGIAEE